MSWLAVFHVSEWVLRIVMFAVVLRRRFAPGMALAWLTIIFLEPLVGGTLYALVGDRRLGRRRARRRRDVVASMRFAQANGIELDHVTRPRVEPAAMPLILQAERCGGMPIVGGNRVELLPDTRRTIDRLVEDIDGARHHVHMAFYIFAPDQTGWRVAEALVRAAARGVECRVLADAAGSRHLFARRGLAQFPKAAVRRR